MTFSDERTMVREAKGNCDPCAKTQLLLGYSPRSPQKGQFGHSQDYEDMKIVLSICGPIAKKTDVDGHDLVQLITWLLYNYSLNPYSIGHKLKALIKTVEGDKENRDFLWFYEMWTGLRDSKEFNPLEILNKIGQSMIDCTAIEIDDAINLLGGASITFNKASDYDLIEKVLEFYKKGRPSAIKV